MTIHPELKSRLYQAIENFIDQESDDMYWFDPVSTANLADLMTNAAIIILETIIEQNRYLKDNNYFNIAE